MTSRTVSGEEPRGRLQAIRDFLPPPDELAFREESVKVTLVLSRASVDFFKAEARKHHTQYQRMIRRLLDAYQAAHADGSSTQEEAPLQAGGEARSTREGRVATAR
ncbi:MAG: CopG family transcriptional regulator [bacterium]|jgi:predicted DNA binding CopG/RHH family protein|nr:CopG family transcriptional regulator [bacterium]